MKKKLGGGDTLARHVRKYPLYYCLYFMTLVCQKAANMEKLVNIKSFLNGHQDESDDNCF